MAWVNPTGTVDTGGTWTDDGNAIDGNTGTFAYSANNNNNNYLEMTHAALSCDKVQIYVNKYKSGAEDVNCDVDVYYSAAWHNIFSGIVTADTWTEKTIGSTETVTSARVKPNALSAGKHMRIKALQFNEIAGPTQKSISGSLYTTGSTAKMLTLSRIISGVLYFTGSLVKALVLSQLISGAVNFIGSITNVKSFIRILTGAVNFTGNITKNISIALSGVVNLTGHAIKKFMAKIGAFYDDRNLKR